MIVSTVTPPLSINELKERANNLAGQSLIEIADSLALPVPIDLKHAKGWIGQLLELALGATAGSKALHDFPQLKIEMKTIPLNDLLKPTESTYVCTAPTTMQCLYWEQSWVCQKMQHILWVPIEASQNKPIAERKILQPFLWQPNAEQQAILKQDWEELTELLSMGGIEKLSAKYGTYLHIRPKAANSRVLIDTCNEHGDPIKTVPKGFYLRTSFTRELLSSIH